MSRVLELLGELAQLVSSERRKQRDTITLHTDDGRVCMHVAGKTIRQSPSSARAMARALVNAADEAEAKFS